MNEERKTGRNGRPGGRDDAPAWQDQAEAGSSEQIPAQITPIVASAPPGETPGRSSWLESRRQRLRYWWRGASPNLRGSVFMFG
ncbi:hypothetical protein ACC794_37435, partial [Rhizobium ruizarguesonis]